MVREAKERQTSFAGGELAPGLYGRTDLAKYGSGARTLRNFIVTPHGTAASRPGSIRVDRIVNDGVAVLVPLIYADGEAAVAVFTDQLVRFYPCYDTLEPIINHGVPEMAAALVTTYTETYLAELQFSQYGDVLQITHNAFAPREILRTASTTWRGRGGALYPTALDFTVPAFPSYGGTPRLWYPEELRDYNNNLIFDAPSTAADSSHPARAWQWAVTRVIEYSDGTRRETMPEIVDTAFTPTVTEYMITSAYSLGDAVYVGTSGEHWYYAKQTVPATPNEVIPGSTAGWGAYWQRVKSGEDVPRDTEREVTDRQVVYPDRVREIRWHDWSALLPAEIEAQPAGDPAIVATRVYRGRAGRFGFLGESTGDRFEDDGATPDFAIPPPQGVNPFSGDYPRCGCFYEGRRVLAGTTLYPSTAWASATDELLNFDAIAPAQDDDAIEFTLASSRYEQIRWLVPRRQLLIGTAAGEWAVAGSGQGEVITPNSIAARLQTEHGSSTLAPLAFSDVVMFVQSKGAVPHALVFDGQSGSYRTIDLSIYSSHLFEGHTIVSWAWSEDPWRIVWAVRDDGALLSLTWVPEQEMMAWAQHELAGGGLAESVCTVPQGEEDVVYLVVKRGDERYLERLASRQTLDIRDAHFVDNAFVYDGRNQALTATTTPTYKVAIDDFGHFGGGIHETVRLTWQDAGGALADDSVLGIAIGDVIEVTVGDEVTRVELGAKIGEGVYDCRVVEVLDEDGETASSVRPDSWNVDTYEWARCVSSVATGALNLDANGGTLAALADGDAIIDNVEWAAPPATGFWQGNLLLERPAAVVRVGLLYYADFESLDAASARDAQKTVKKSVVGYERARGGKVGMSFEVLHDIINRDVGDSYAASGLSTGRASVVMLGEWAEHGRTCVRQDQPLPFTILELTRILEVGG